MTYTDYLGNPIAVGDIIAYPTCTGSSSADMNLAVVTEILDLIPNYPNDLTKNTAYLQSDLKKQPPPRRHITNRFIPDDPQPANGSKWFLQGTYERDDSKAYVLRVRKLRDGYANRYRQQDRAVILKNVERAIVVTDRAGNV